MKKASKKVASKKSTNKELEKMLAIIKEAEKDGKKSVVVFTTNRSHHKANINSDGFGASDLKPKFYEAYRTLFCQYTLLTRLVNSSEMAVEWTVLLR